MPSLTIGKISLRQKWIEALRNGKYRQIKNWLKTDLGYCCLGVACEVYSENVEPLKCNVDCKLYQSDVNRFSFEKANTTSLPDNVAKAFGLSLDDQEVLTYMDDTRSDDFEKIAKTIENTLTGDSRVHLC